MVELRWTNEAQTWLRDIFDYIAADNPQAAASVVEGIYAKAQVLLSFPDVGYRYRQVEEGEIRILLYGHYRIAYLHRQDSESVVILGVWRGSKGCVVPMHSEVKLGTLAGVLHQADLSPDEFIAAL